MRVVIFTALMFLMASCSDHARDASLLRADAMMESAPDSALALLEAVDCATFTPADSDFYALLLTQAQIKNYIDVDSDSLIARARYAYRGSRDGDLRCRSAFYYAQTAYFGGRLSRAMRAALEAHDAAVEQDSPLWTARTAELIADIFARSYNYPQSLEMRREAADQYLLAGKVTNHRYSLCDLAVDCSNQGDLESSVTMLDSLIGAIRSDESVDTMLLTYAQRAMIESLVDLGRYGEADSLINDCMTGSDWVNDFGLDLSKSKVAANNGDIAQANALLASAYGMTEDERYRVNVMYAKYVQSQDAHDYKTAAELSDTLLSIQSKIAEEMLNESVMSSKSEHFAEKSKLLGDEVNRKRIAIIGVIVIALVLMSLVVTVFMQRVKVKNKELESSASEIYRISQKSDIQGEIIQRLFKGRWLTFNNLCNDYFEFGELESFRGEMLKSIRRELNRIKSPASLEDIARDIDEYFGGILSDLRKECTFLKDDDIVFLSLVIAGFSAKTVCLMIDMGYKNFYQKRSRLLEKIRMQSPALADRIAGLIRR